MPVKEQKTEDMINAGVHIGYTRTRRHPSVKSLVAGTKNRMDILDVDKLESLLDKACEFVKALGKEDKVIIFIGSKPEAREAIKGGADSIGMPYIIERWIGGTLTNFPEIKKRIEKMHNLKESREKGTTNVYTKKERLLIDREIARLEKYFLGLSSLKNIPGAIFVVDSKKEHIAVEEAKKVKIPIISVSNSDCDIKEVTYPVVGNDSSISSIGFLVGKIISAYKEGRAEAEKTEVSI